MKNSRPTLRDRLAADPGLRIRLEGRSRLLQAIRAHFLADDFLEVTTPCLSPAGDPAPHLDSFTSTLHTPRSKAPLWLATSPEHFMKRMLAAGFERIFQIGPFFRDEELGPQHNPEFTGLEWYEAHAGAEGTMERTERLVRSIAQAVFGRVVFERAGHRIDLGPAFRRLSVRQALEELAGVAVPRDWDPGGLRTALAAAGIEPADDDSYDDLVNRALVARVEPALPGLGPVFLTDYPAPMAALARLSDADPLVAERFELFAGGLELCNGYGELTDPDEQRRRFEDQQAQRRAMGRPGPPTDGAFLRALEQGMPAAGGNALGVDRLLMLLCEAERIEQVLAFPLSLELGV